MFTIGAFGEVVHDLYPNSRQRAIFYFINHNAPPPLYLIASIICTTFMTTRSCLQCVLDLLVYFARRLFFFKPRRSGYRLQVITSIQLLGDYALIHHFGSYIFFISLQNAQETPSEYQTLTLSSNINIGIGASLYLHCNCVLFQPVWQPRVQHSNLCPLVPRAESNCSTFKWSGP